MDRFQREPPKTVLVACTRRLGDVLLATPLVRSLRRAWPDAAIDMLVFRGTESVVESNPDLRDVIAVGESDSLGRRAGTFRALWNRYDLACSTQTSDRATLYAAAAGRVVVGTLDPSNAPAWKRGLLDAWVPFDDLNVHTVSSGLALCSILGVERVADVVVSWNDADEAQALQTLPFNPSTVPYAVLHVSPKFPYKTWTAKGWVQLAHWLGAAGLRPIIVAGPEASEIEQADSIARRASGALNLAGKLRLPAVGALLADARIYVGTDTAVTHMAAAIGVPTIALFGPSNPVKWGPWPKGYVGPESPWKMVGSNRVGNVTLVQGETACVPCREEGCERRVGSLSDCLQHLPAGRVIEAVRAAIGAGRAEQAAAAP